MDSEITDLKQEVEELKAMSHDTNRMVRGMRRGQRWRTIFAIVWWLTIVGVTGAAYYYYIQPYVDEALKAYGNTKDFQVEVQNFFAQFGHAKTP